jgi:hypothetical protein
MSEKEKRNGPQFSNMTAEQLEGDSDDEDEEEVAGDKEKVKGKIKKKTGGSGRRRIDIKFIENKSRRQVTFSRRKRGLMKKVRFRSFSHLPINAVVGLRPYVKFDRFSAQSLHIRPTS